MEDIEYLFKNNNKEINDEDKVQSCSSDPSVIGNNEGSNDFRESVKPYHGHKHECHEHYHDDDCCEHGHNHNHNHDCSDHEGHGHHHDCCEHDHEGHGHHHEDRGHNYEGHCEHNGHHHEHNEGTKYEVDGFDLLETHSHEGATVCSFEKMIDADIEISAENVEIIDGRIKALVEWLEEKNAVIGHIKGYINEPESNVTFSTTGSGINYGKHISNKRKMAFAAIVIGVAEEELKDKIAELFKTI